MPFVYSTASNDTVFTKFSAGGNDLPRIVKCVLIKGGSNVATKRLVTPLGVRTEVSEEDLDFLNSKPNFLRMIKYGFIKIDERKLDAEVPAADMTTRDDSAPRVPQDFEKDKDGVAPIERDLKEVVNKLAN